MSIHLGALFQLVWQSLIPWTLSRQMSKQSLWGWLHPWGLLLHQVAPKANVSCFQMQSTWFTNQWVVQVVVPNKPIWQSLQSTCLKTRKTLEQILADNSGKSVEQIHADAERDYWMSAQETLEYGFIDEIMANNSLAKQPRKQTRRSLLFWYNRRRFLRKRIPMFEKQIDQD